MEKIHFLLNILGWTFLLICCGISYFNRKNEKRLFIIQLILNGLALACFIANLILKFL